MPIDLDTNAMRDRVIALRNERGWAQADLARESGISQPTISMIENGIRRVNDLQTAVRLANAFGLSMDDFLTNARPGSDVMISLKRRYAELQRAEWAAWAECENAQADFFRAEKRGVTLNDQSFGEKATVALRAWSDAHAATRDAATAMLRQARDNALQRGWSVGSIEILP